MVYTIKPKDRSAIMELADRIAETRLHDLMAAYGTESERREALYFDLPLLPPRLRNMVQLLVNGEPLAEDKAGEIFSEEAIGAFIRMGIMAYSDGHISLDGLRLVYHFGIWSFCENIRSPAIKYYYGIDSLGLGRLLLPARGKVLDVCSGTGTQGLLCALTADRVVAVDRESSVEKLFRVNSILNGVEKKMTLYIGDTAEPVKGQKFDRICCNPPLLPVPDGVPYPVVGNGGPDGLTVVMKLMRSLPELLNEKGHCQIIGTILGDESGPCLGELERISREQSLDIFLLLPHREALGRQSAMVRGLAITSHLYENIGMGDAMDTYYRHFRSLGATRLYSYLMNIMPSEKNRSGRVEITRHYARNASMWAV